MKKRIDLILTEKFFVESRAKAQAMIMAGQIYINERKVLKSGEIYNLGDNVIIKDLHSEWVSRGALKLLHAINFFKVRINNYVCLDIGASTGGFTEVLLFKKAKKIYSVDVGLNQLHEKLKQNGKVINIPKTNARYLNKEIIPEKIDLIVCDVSFISMKKVIFPSLRFLDNNMGSILALIKPQFESEKKYLKKGIIKDPEIHNKICSEFKVWFQEECRMKVKGIIESPIKGPKGNKEFLIYAIRD